MVLLRRVEARYDFGMTARDLLQLFDYCYWANDRLFPVIAQLTEEAFRQRVAGSYGSVRNTLVHALSTEWGWLDRCGGLQRGPRLEPEAYATPQALISDWRRVETHMREYLAGLEDHDATRGVNYPGADGATRSMPLGVLLQHAAIHGIHYRGQVALLLRELGHAPGNVDLLFYYGEKHGVAPW